MTQQYESEKMGEQCPIMIEARNVSFTYEGEELYANLATSAKGYAYFTLRCGDEEYTSYEVFGNSVDKRIHFKDPAAVARLAGKPVTLTVRLRDADLYAIRFGK